MKARLRFRSKSREDSSDSLSIQMESSWGGMNIEIINSLFISRKKIEDDTTISSVNQAEESQSLSDILPVRISGTMKDSVSSILMETWSKIL